MTGNKLLSIILLSFNDLRVERAIRSIRKFDDAGVVRIVVVDGGSNDAVKQVISQNLTHRDIFISESDKGIFDALNKGLDACDTENIGWLGSDDIFTGKVRASQVISVLENNDLLVANLVLCHKGYVTRIFHALPSRLGLVKYGWNNPHFATFGKAILLKSEKFRLGLRGSDIEYFIKIFNKKPRVFTINEVATIQEEGGFSNATYLGVLRTNIELVSLHAQYTNWFFGPIIVITKLCYKLLIKGYFKVVRVPLPIEAEKAATN